MKYLSLITRPKKRFYHNLKYCVKTIVVLIIISLTSSLKTSAQSGTLTFSNTSTANLGTMLYDNRTYSTDISGVEIKVFNASSETNAASRTSTGSLVLVRTPDLTSTHPAIFSNNASTGTLVFDYENSNRPKYIVLASTSGTEFRFSSVYIVEPETWIKPPKIKFEGFRNGISTGSVILSIDQDNGEYEKTFNASYFPVDIFGNVDEIRISRGWIDEFTGNLDGFNNFVFSAPISSYVNVSTNSLGIGATESSIATFNITSNTSWTVSSNETWLTASPSSGSNNSSITLTAQANPSTTSPRTATITITGGNTITVTQPAANATLAVSKTALSIGALAYSTTTFDITSNTNWTVSKDQTWLSASPTSGSNNATVTLTVQANPYATPRTATVAVAGVGSPKTVTVTQAGASPTLSVSSKSLAIANSKNSTANFQIISNTDWSIMCDQKWLSVSPSSGNGSAWITLTAAEDNPITTKRFATITVSTSGVANQVILVEQDGTSTIFSVSPSTINIGSDAGSTSFTVSSNILWTTLIDQSWVAIFPTSGSFTSTVSVNYEANNTTSERTSTITINGANGNNKYVQITQAGVAKSLTASATKLKVSEVANNSISFDITSNTSWSITSNQTWLSISPSGGMNNAKITVACTEDNPLALERVATLTISADGLTDKTITVTQAAAPAHLTVSENSLNIASEDNSIVKFNILSNTNWAIESSQSWLLPSDANGNQNKTVTLTASLNPSNTSRECIITVKAAGVSDKLITVTQLPNLTTGLSNNSPNLYQIWSTKEMLHITNIGLNTLISVYNISGRKIISFHSNQTEKTFPLTQGMYIVKINNEAHKIVVK